ncbi:golgin subfamily A member 5 isoform X2 [Erinaceus europaeus]|uniref:Golgin subfamily A member 5 n=1 Tax=Erinaceus europaeus TaxID=9365 RepID=A0ABM3WK10_ERIEU|nr:golgin subfamily A member 5 isoform X2 [Erinaceus europaeus]
MSWLADLAGKAEDLLNRVDQGAATALSKKETPGHGGHGGGPSDPAAEGVGHQAPLPAPRVPPQTPQAPEGAGGPRPSSQFVRRKRSEPDDELLFDFLNSPQKEPAGRAGARKERSKAPALHRAHPAEPHTTAAAGVRAPGGGPGSRGLEASGSDSGHESRQPSSQEGEPPDGPRPEHGAATPSDDGRSHELSNLRLENQLLRSEIQSLNQEVASVLQRARETQEELDRARASAEKRDVDRSQRDLLARELQAQVDDLTEAVAAKDSQLAVLRVRLQEADQLLEARTEALQASQSEKSRIMRSDSEGSSLQDLALQTLQERLHEADASLQRGQESYKQMQSEFAARLSKMEAERQSLAEAVALAERKCSEEKRRVEGLQQQVKALRSSLDSSRQELTDYKQKATRILQSKEKLISSLKEGSGLEGFDSSVATSVELEELRHEREMQREEMQRLTGQVHQLRAELQDVESQQASEAESAREELRFLQDQVAAQKASRQELEAELERQKQESHYLEEDLHRTKSTLQSRVRDREAEIQKLRTQLTNKALSSSSQGELERRLHQLTETLIQKQTVLESLSTEKSALAFQLERLERQLSSASSGGEGSAVIVPGLGLDAGEGARLRSVPVLFSDAETSLAGMYGRVRKAASSIDQFSIRLGIFLRRYPVVRVFVVLYMALLHLWVVAVLLTYSPEVHQDQPRGR